MSRTGLAAAASSTRFVLPFKPDLLAGGGSRQLLQRFDDVQPTLLLFLQKLACLAVTDAADPARCRCGAALLQRCCCPRRRDGAAAGPAGSGG
jgi:hypothetical protein